MGRFFFRLAIASEKIARQPDALRGALEAAAAFSRLFQRQLGIS